MEGDYLAHEQMIAFMNIEEVGKKRSSLADLPDPTRKEPERVYCDKMVSIKPSLTLPNHLKPIYVTSHLEEVPFKKVLINGGQSLMCSHSNK